MKQGLVVNNKASGGKQLLVHIPASSLGRGRLWVNGNDVGRYWTLQRNNGAACPAGAKTCPTQQYYHVPASWLNPAGSDSKNLLVVFDVTGATDLSGVGLATSSMGSSNAAVSPIDPTKVVSCEF